MSDFIQLISAGLPAAIIAATLLGIREIFQKYLTKTKNVPPLVSLICQYLIVVPLLFVWAFFSNKFDINFLTLSYALLNMVILGVGAYLHLKAITMEDFALTLPFLSFTPLWLIPIELIFFHDSPTILALLGILTIIGGTFYLGRVEAKEKGLGWQIKQGSRLMLLVSLIYAFAGTIDKLGSLSSTPLNYLFWSYLFITFLYFITIKTKKNVPAAKLSVIFKKHWLWFLIIALIMALGSWLLMNAYTTILVNYAISLKRAAFLIPILLGPVFFKEKNLLKRLPGILLMLAGAVIIIIWG